MYKFIFEFYQRFPKKIGKGEKNSIEFENKFIRSQNLAP